MLFGVGADLGALAGKAISENRPLVSAAADGSVDDGVGTLAKERNKRHRGIMSKAHYSHWHWANWLAWSCSSGGMTLKWGWGNKRVISRAGGRGRAERRKRVSGGEVKVETRLFSNWRICEKFVFHQMLVQLAKLLWITLKRLQVSFEV